MARVGKIVALLFGLVLLIPIGWFVAFSLYWEVKSVPSAIVDFHPTEFSARGGAAFFYSIGNELKNSDEIDPHAPTLLRGKLENYLVSPDGTKIAVVTNGKLVIVGGRQPLFRVVAPVDSIYRKRKPIGERFFRDDHFQWTRESKSLYLIKDEYNESTGSQLYSANGELWRYDIETGTLRPVLKPFPAYEFFFGTQGVYFSVPTADGDLRLRYFDGTQAKDIGDVGAWAIPVENLASGFSESPFFSFSERDFQNIALSGKGVALRIDEQNGIEHLEIRDRSYLTISQGYGFKGHFHCSDRQRSEFLPGDRYLMFNFYCENYKGQLLVDTQTGNYEQLPADTRVYLTLNTVTHPTYRVTSSGMMDW